MHHFDMSILTLMPNKWWHFSTYQSKMKKLLNSIISLHCCKKSKDFKLLNLSKFYFENKMVVSLQSNLKYIFPKMSLFLIQNVHSENWQMWLRLLCRLTTIFFSKYDLKGFMSLKSLDFSQQCKEMIKF